MPASLALHIAVFAHAAWGRSVLVALLGTATDIAQGHIRPLCALSSKMVHLRDVHVTFLTSRQLRDKVAAEVARSFEDGEEDLESRIR